MAPRLPLAALVALACAAPADASTLDFREDTYFLEGTAADEHLSLVVTDGDVTFTDRDGELTGTAALPAECAPTSSHTIRCATPVPNPPVLDGGAGDDQLIGSGRGERMIGGDGDDFVDVAGDAASRVQCGAGADLYRANFLGFGGATATTSPDVVADCEAAASGPSEPLSGNVDLFTQAEKLFKVRERRIVAKGVSVCSFIGRACRLEVVARVERGRKDQPLARPYRLGRSTFEVPAGAPHQVAVKLTRREIARFERLPGRFLTFRVTLRKPGRWVTGAPFGTVGRRYEGQPARR
jgi:hypothetical protein